MSIAIEFNHVGKQYRLGLVSTKTLSHDLNRWWQMTVCGKEDPYLKIGETNDRTTLGDSEYVWALRDIDFKVEQGDVVGIIGKNGAGKSTLLKLLSKVTGPTTGVIRARGRIGALLEVGTGFHPEMTGRENIYMNGAIMGMTKNDVTRKLDEIISFSGCERYIDTPVKRYSSGMTVRLGFAVAAHLEPEILVVDEVLAVGDAEFQKKAIGKMQDVSKGEGRTVLFVSHNMASIRMLCKRGVLLENGSTKRIGEINDVVNYYLQENSYELGDIQSIAGDDLNRYRLRNEQYHPVEVIEAERLSLYKIDSTEPAVFRVRLRKNNGDVKKIQLTTLIDDIKFDNRVGLSCSQEIDISKCDDEFDVQIKLNHHNLTAGKYKMNFWVGYGDVFTSMQYYDRIFDSLTFEVETYQKKHINYWASDWGFSYFDDCEVELV